MLKCSLLNVAAIGLAGLGLTLAGCESPQATADTDPAVPSRSMPKEVKAPAPTSQFDKPGFATYVRDGRLWVLDSGSEAQAEFLRTGEPAKNVTWISAGPRGMTLKSESSETLLAYLASKPGYRAFVEDGRVWVFKAGSDALSEYLKTGEPAKSVTWIGEGPRGSTLRSDSSETLLAYIASKPGFYTAVEDGRVWVFEQGSEALKSFKEHGEPAKSVTWIGEGPRGSTLRSDSSETLLAYVAAVPGFMVYPEDGRLWVFREGSDAHKQFMTSGEPAKSITLVGQGPRGMSLRAADRDVAMAYLAGLGS